MDGHTHHHGLVEISRGPDGYWHAFRETEMGHWVPEMHAAPPGQEFVCDSCGKAFIAELWPNPGRGQWQNGVRLRPEGRRAARRRRKRHKALNLL